MKLAHYEINSEYPNVAAEQGKNNSVNNKTDLQAVTI